MIAEDWYRTRAAKWSAVRDGETRVALRYSRLRLLSFGAAAVLAAWAWHRGTAPGTPVVAVAASAAFAAFMVLVRKHARVLERLARAEAGLRLAAIGRARLARDWQALPEVPPPPPVDLESHPYARDLDLFGHASLTTWLGATATADGARLLRGWLLAPAAPAGIVERQTAVDELAPRREWRESLAIEGTLTALGPSELSRFLEWTAVPESAVPPVMRVLAVLLPASVLLLLALYLGGGVDGAWWLAPLGLNVILSFVYAPKMFRTFDRVAIGEQALTRYGTMLDLVCSSNWTSPLLAGLHAAMCDGTPAPSAVRRIAGLAAWSELRRGAALLHFPVQAFTLWDFHVLLAMERWRRRSGVQVRVWLDSLGTFDALSTLATVRADEPDWAMPQVDSSADRYAGTAVAHPLIAAVRRVANDVEVGPPGTLLLVTGSNMSGKSTLLRAIGVNAVLAQAGAPVCSASLRMPPVEIQTSIRVQDSLELGLSYFMAALARLKQIVDAADRHRGGIPDAPRPPALLYLLDEVLQGTNSVERGLAVRAVAQHLLDAGAIGAMTTHDLALAGEEPLRSSAALAHFTEQVGSDGTMTFDYRLRAGLATSTNALRLMQAIGIAPR
jgi:hypothetical protein